ncbi:MAG: hypothetical protein M3540_05025 [Actinomycetota bacterium]|nr:hypothetical protein [Actinomycetota bacterium]
MRRVLLVAAAVALAAVVAALSARALSRPDPLVQAEADGCKRNNTLIYQHQAPNWAYVNDRDAPAGGPPPEPVWLEGTVSSEKQPLYPARPTGVDNPLTHLSYDFVFDVAPDTEYQALLGGSPTQRTGNFAEEIEDVNRIHVEREEAAFPSWAWPDRGDRVKLLGSWIWDCDHSAYGERTEVHPFRAIWVGRQAPTTSRTAQVEGDLFISTDGTYASRQADCSHRAKGDRAAFRACVAEPEPPQEVSGTYRFALRAPPRPAGARRLDITVVDMGSTRNSPRPTVTQSGRDVVVSLTIPARAGLAPTRLVVARRIVVGWTPRPVRARPVHLRVRLDRVLTRRAMDPAGPTQSTRLGQTTAPPGEWIVYWKLGSRWGRWPGVLAARDGRTFRGGQIVDVFVPRGRPWTALFVTRECDFGALGNAVTARGTVAPCPRGKELGNLIGDDVPGYAVRTFASPAASLGRHVVNSRLPGSTCPPANARGCYAVTFTVTRAP